MDSLLSPLSFMRGATMWNRFMLAPMTNQQSHNDGTRSDDELRWLRVRARGGFGYIITCASHVQENGKGFPGELGIFSDQHMEGLKRLASALRGEGSRSAVQLYHGGMRAIVGRCISPSGNAETNSPAMTEEEIGETIECFIVAAERTEKAGFDGVELHAAHGYLISQFLSPIYNRRQDDYGGSPERRSRFLFEIVKGIRARCGVEFQLGVRLSPERFGQELAEIREVVRRLVAERDIDFVDMSLWDVFKEPEDERFRGRSLMSLFTELDRRDVRLGVAGKVIKPHDAVHCLDNGADFVTLGKVAILHHDYPMRLAGNLGFTPLWIPVTADYLRGEGLGESFIRYLSTWTNFVKDLEPPPGTFRFDIDEYLRKGASH